SDEGISSRTLAERLQTLQDEGILTRSDDPSHGLKAIYRLTEAGIDLLPVLATLGAWGSKHRKADDKLARIADDLATGGEPALERMKETLRAQHMG
ncbi:transcriptional regulator, partial [Mesorhizobium sp. M2A.F.Ca.ET.040.01.1.1]